MSTIHAQIPAPEGLADTQPTHGLVTLLHRIPYAPFVVQSLTDLLMHHALLLALSVEGLLRR